MKKIVFATALFLGVIVVWAQDIIHQPEIKFHKLIYDYDTIPFAGNGIAVFVFTNVGNAPLILNNVKATCGCTVPHWSSKPIAPQTSDTIFVDYNTHRSGDFNKGIIVYSNAKTESVRLIIRGVVENPKK